jgi:hypothetical protein
MGLLQSFSLTILVISEIFGTALLERALISSVRSVLLFDFKLRSNVANNDNYCTILTSLTSEARRLVKSLHQIQHNTKAVLC